MHQDVIGNSAHLLKIGSKRRRTRAEIDQHRAFQESQMSSMADKDQRIRELERQVNDSKSKLDTGAQAESLVAQMLDAGYLLQQEDGSFAPRQEVDQI